MAGMKITVVKEIQDRGVTWEEGKSPIAFPIFKRLCQSMAASGSSEHVYAKYRLNLEWIMIAKSENCVNSHVNHLRWRDDTM